jgi:multicomponent Na+:H+ antiporter subunit D
MLLCIGITILVTIIVLKQIVSDEDHLFKFMNLILLILSGMNGMVMVNDVFSMYVFLEITSVCSFILISFNKNIDSLEGAFKYLIMSTIATALMLSAIALLLLVSGSTNFFEIHSVVSASKHTSIIMFSIGIFIAGLFIKSGIMPFHGWLPDAYTSAPAPVSILLAGIITKTGGVYSLIRIVISVFGFQHNIDGMILLVGAFSIVLGAISALGQTDLKRMLAYSSISQVGYIVIGLGTGTALGVFGAVFHLFNHTIFKSLLFVNSAAVENQTGTRNMEKLSGLASRMPLTGLTSAIGSLSASGIPPLSGFWSKLLIIIALWQSNHHIYAIIAIFASILTLSYMLSMQRKIFFGKIKEELQSIKEAEFGFILPAILLAIITIAVGILFPFMPEAFMLNIAHIIGG